MVAGTEVYNVDSSPVTARGASYTNEELDTAFGGSVSQILQDTAGTEDLQDILTKVVTTEFSESSLRRVLSHRPSPEQWRVGESLAEAFLVEHRDCEFPWPSGRDLRNPAASPAGTDLVGFQKTIDTSNPHRFAFGEVKTSEQKAWPPSVMHGRHGLEKQLESLRDAPEVKDALVCYLGHHVQGTAWAPRYQSAAKRYLANPTDVSLFGVLVRDVEPKKEDLSARATNLSAACPTATGIELRAMYCPSGSIAGFAQRVTTTSTQGGQSP